MQIKPKETSDCMVEEYMDRAIAPVEAVLDIAVQHGLDDQRVLSSLICAVSDAKRRLYEMAAKMDDKGILVSTSNHSWFEYEVTGVHIGVKQ
jgi:hypothetical protein